jgi:hypothetical protein
MSEVREKTSATVSIFRGGLWSAQKTTANKSSEGKSKKVTFYIDSQTKASDSVATDLQRDVKHYSS